MKNPGKLSITAGSLLIVNTMLGAGAISLPGCFVGLGWATASGILALALALTFVSLIFLTYSAEMSQIFSYPEMCREVGKPLGIILESAIVLNCYGATLCYGLYMVEYITKLVSVPGLCNLGQRAVVGLVILAPLFFLAHLRSLKKLSFVSWLTMGATTLVILELVFYTFFSGYKTKNMPVKALDNGYTKGIFPIIFSLGCQQNAVVVYSELLNRGMGTSVWTMGLGCVFGGMIYALIGYLASRLFGAFKEKNFLLILIDNNSHFVNYVKGTYDKVAIFPKLCVFAFIMVLFSAFPIQTFSARNSLFGLWTRKPPLRKSVFLVNTAQFVLIYTVILSGLSSDKVVGLIGMVSCPIIAFTLPSIIYMKFVQRRNVFFYLASLILVSSVLMIGYGLLNIREILFE